MRMTDFQNLELAVCTQQLKWPGAGDSVCPGFATRRRGLRRSLGAAKCGKSHHITDNLTAPVVAFCESHLCQMLTASWSHRSLRPPTHPLPVRSPAWPPRPRALPPLNISYATGRETQRLTGASVPLPVGSRWSSRHL